METVAEALLEVHPTITAAVPRFFEKMYANILEKGHREMGLKRQIFDWALRSGSQGGVMARVRQTCVVDREGEVARLRTRWFIPRSARAWVGVFVRFVLEERRWRGSWRNFSGRLICRCIRDMG